MKHYTLFTILLFSSILLSAQEFKMLIINDSVVLSNLIENPFFESNSEFIPPLTLNSIDDLKAEIGEPENLEVVEIPNRFDNKLIDIQYFLTYPECFIYYYYVDSKDVYYRLLYQINTDIGTLNTPLRWGMSKSQLKEIVGDPREEVTYEENSELIYTIDQNTWYGSINFNFNNSEDSLTAINFWLNS